MRRFHRLLLSLALLTVASPLLAYTIYLKDGIRPDGPFGGQDAQVGFAWIVATATALGAACSLAVGRASDRAGRRKPGQSAPIRS